MRWMQNAPTSKQTTYSHINSATVGHDGTGLLAASYMLHCKCSDLRVPPAKTPLKSNSYALDAECTDAQIDNIFTHKLCNRGI